MEQDDRPPDFSMIYIQSPHWHFPSPHIPYLSQIFHNEWFNLGLPTFSFVSSIVKMSIVKYLVSVPVYQCTSWMIRCLMEINRKLQGKYHLDFKPIQKTFNEAGLHTCHLTVWTTSAALFALIFSKTFAPDIAACATTRCVWLKQFGPGRAVGPTGCCSTRLLVTSRKAHSRMLQQTRPQQPSRTPT